MSTVKFHPWRGDKYIEGFKNRRVLVLGESHYHAAGDLINGHSEITNQVVLRQFDGTGTTYSFFTHIAKTFLGHNVYLDRSAKSAFWNQVAFYNYVQESVGVGSRVRPTSQMWAAAERPFFEVLDELQPEVVIAFGYELWNNMPMRGYEGPCISHRAQHRTWLYPSAGGTVLTYGVRHPSSGYSSHIWHPGVIEALRISGTAQ